MTSVLLEWLGLLLRWAHVIAGIMWIGDSLLFMWIDSHLTPDPQGRTDVAGVTWLLHGGGYYHLEKRLLVPGRPPPRLRWFWLEATSTWVSGMLLLVLIYYMSADAFMIDRAVSGLTSSQAIAFGVSMIIGGWLVYDGLWQSNLRNRPAAGSAVTLIFLGAVAYLATYLLSARAAFLHIGAMLGTIMAANVWVRILPPQYRMLQAARQGREVDFRLGVHAKIRSTHNTYFTFPVIFLMLSPHIPIIFAARPAWITVGLIGVLGAGARHLMLVGWQRAKGIAVAACAALLALVYMTALPVLFPRVGSFPPAAAVPPFSDVRAIIVQRCAVCHSEEPVQPGFMAPPANVKMDTPLQIRLLAPRIRARAIEQKTMPPGNVTGMHDDERALLRRWLDAGAPLK
jgi:uncharacterized membrane protein